MHEARDFDKKFVAPLKQFDLSIDDYFLTQEESVSGEKMPTKYALINADRTHDVAGVGQIISCPARHRPQTHRSQTLQRPGRNE